MNSGNNIERNARFEYLMDMLLERRATDAEKAELRRMVIDGYGDRFQDRFDEVINSDLGTGDMTPEKQQEILMNILDREPAAAERNSDHRIGQSAPSLPAGKRGRSVWPWAAAAAIAILCIAGLWLFNSHTTNTELTTSKEQHVHPEQKFYSGRQFVKLSDGSSVLMSENAKLRVKDNFNEDVREVELEGKAYFDIAHNPDKEFRIMTGDVITTVLGTAFSIDATGKNIEVTVTRGKVQVGDKSKVYGMLSRDQQIRIDMETKQFVARSTNAEKVTEWKKDFLVFDNVTMEVAATIIYDKYNVRVSYTNEAIKNCSDINASFIDGENLDQVLQVISTLIRVRYKMLPDGNVLFEGEGCPASP